MESASKKIAVRFFWQTLGLCCLMALVLGLVYTLVHSQTESQLIRLSFGFLSILTLGLVLALHAHHVLIKPLARLSFSLRKLDIDTLLSEDFVVLRSNQLHGEFDEIETQFHLLLQKLHHRHREVLVSRQKLEKASAHFHENKLQALGEMAAGIAHEINNPLAILVGRLEQLREVINPQALDKRTETAIQSMEKTVFRIEEAVHDLEILASNPSSEELRKVNLSRLVSRLSKVVRNRFQADEIIFESQISPEIEIEAREVELSQAFLFLLENAAEAAKTGDERWVRIEIPAASDGANLCLITIQDSGKGLSKDLRTKLFQPFFTTKKEGRGMGLSLAKSVIEGHDGRLSLQFEPGPTIVKILLPLRQRAKLLTYSA